MDLFSRKSSAFIKEVTKSHVPLFVMSELHSIWISNCFLYVEHMLFFASSRIYVHVPMPRWWFNIASTYLYKAHIIWVIFKLPYLISDRSLFHKKYGISSEFVNISGGGLAEFHKKMFSRKSWKNAQYWYSDRIKLKTRNWLW